MTADKLKQYVALVGGFLGALLLFLQALGINLEWFNQQTIDSFVGVLLAAVPMVLVIYGVYKNSYIITQKAKKQEEVLKQKGLK